MCWKGSKCVNGGGKEERLRLDNVRGLLRVERGGGGMERNMNKTMIQIKTVKRESEVENETMTEKLCKK